MAKHSSQKLVRALKLASLSVALPILLTMPKSWAQEATDAEISNYIEKFRTNDDWRVYQDTVRDLARIGPLAVPALQQALKDPDIRVRVYAADALIGMGYEAKEAVPELVEALKDKNKYVRASAGEALEAIGSRATLAIPALIDALKDEDAYVRYIAAKALFQMGPKAKNAVPALSQTLKDENGNVRAAAAEALGGIGPKAKSAVDNLTQSIKDKNPYVRSASAAALGAIGLDAKPAVSGLIGLLKNQQDNKYVRSAAAIALGEIGAHPKTTVPALIEAIDDSKERVRAAAASALGNMGCKARSAMPKLLESLNEAEEEQAGAIAGIGGIAGDCHEKAEKLSDSEITRLITDLETAVNILQQNQLEDEEISWLNRPLKALIAQKNSRLSSIISLWMTKNVFWSGFLIYIICLPSLWGALLLWRPIWLLRLNAALEPYSDIQLVGILSGTKLSLRAFMMLSFFAYRNRVLDAWVAEYIKEARSEFQQKDTVIERDIHIQNSATIDGKKVSPLTVGDLQAKFRQKQCYMLICGEGGSGKLSLACEIAKWAMSPHKEERLCDHLMLPLLIEEGLEKFIVPIDPNNLNPNIEKPKSAFIEAIRGQLQDTINEVKPISEELVVRLLQQQRVLAIVAHFSEMSEVSRDEIRPESPDFPANSLIVISRLEEKLGRVVKTTIKPQRVDGNLLSSFLEDYLSKKDKRSLFSDMEFIDTCRDLSLRICGRDVPVMLVKMYAELAIARQEGKVRGDLTEHLPAMMLGYLNKINNEVMSGKLDNRSVQHDAKVWAWECLKGNYRLSAVKRKDLIAAAGEHSEERLKYLENRLRLVETSGIYHDQIRFTLDPLAEYLAGLQLIDICGDNEKSWRDFLDKATIVSGGSESGKSFLLAVRDCCKSQIFDEKVPDFVAIQLEVLTGLKTPEEEPTEILPTVAIAPESDDEAAVRSPNHTSVTLAEFKPNTEPAKPILPV